MNGLEEIGSNPLGILQMATAIGGGGALPSAEVTELCKNNVAALAGVPVDRVRDELERCLLGRDVDVALQWLLSIGAIELLLPELAATVDLAQEAGRKHKDVWEHTKLVVKQSVRRPGVRWAALLHDIGKVPTRTFTKDGVHFHGHAEVGARMFDKIARRMPFEPEMRKKVRFLIKYHLRSAQSGEDWTDSAVRRVAREMEAPLQDLLDLSRADISSRRPGRRQALLRQISDLAQRIETLRQEDAKVPPLPTGIGNAIMEKFALPPSRVIGDIKRELEAAIEAGTIEERRGDDYYIAWLEESGTLARLLGPKPTARTTALAGPGRAPARKDRSGASSV